MTRKRNAKRRAPRLEALEQRLCLTGFVYNNTGKTSSFGWDGEGQEAASLTYYLGGTPPSNLTITEIEDALVTALEIWAAGADITFSRTSLPDQPDSIDFIFGPIDGPFGILAQGAFPKDINDLGTYAGDVLFDTAEEWEVGDGLDDSSRDLVYVATHEIGHSLGLFHTDVPTAIMFPTVSLGPKNTTLDPADNDAILKLYARRGSSPAKATVPRKLPDVVYDSGDDSDDRPVRRIARRPRGMRPRGLAERRMRFQELG
jgi:hypothetical protein